MVILAPLRLTFPTLPEAALRQADAAHLPKIILSQLSQGKSSLPALNCAYIVSNQVRA
jgi:hypothetical protein